jgi:hypothetical protein
MASITIRNLDGLRASVDVALSMDTAMVDVNAVRVAVPYFAVPPILQSCCSMQCHVGSRAWREADPACVAAVASCIPRRTRLVIDTIFWP